MHFILTHSLLTRFVRNFFFLFICFRQGHLEIVSISVHIRGDQAEKLLLLSISARDQITQIKFLSPHDLRKAKCSSISQQLKSMHTRWLSILLVLAYLGTSLSFSPDTDVLTYSTFCMSPCRSNAKGQTLGHKIAGLPLTIQLFLHDKMTKFCFQAYALRKTFEHAYFK